jgi:ectoine hydroxylase-related dioxygenase (phytanoyl-CoA dioxygenase family)
MTETTQPFADNEYPLSDEQVRFFEEYGYIRLLNVLNSDELSDLSKAMDRILAQRELMHIDPDSEYSRLFYQMVNMWQADEGIRAFVYNRKVAEIARRLAQTDRIRLWHDHALVKMPEDSRETPWHQDLPYWPMVEEGALSCWMAVDDVDERNGCMQFIPGSHKLGRLEPISLVDPQDIFTLPGADAVSMSSAEMMDLPAGSCTFHDGRTFHYATANRTDKPRRAMVTIYMKDGTRYSGNEHCVTDGQGMEAGKPFKGDVFPVLAGD